MHGLSPHPKVSGFPWRDQGLVRGGVGTALRPWGGPPSAGLADLGLRTGVGEGLWVNAVDLRNRIMRTYDPPFAYDFKSLKINTLLAYWAQIMKNKCQCFK